MNHAEWIAPPGITASGRIAAHEPRTDALTPEQREFMAERYAGQWAARFGNSARVLPIETMTADEIEAELCAGLGKCISNMRDTRLRVVSSPNEMEG